MSCCNKQELFGFGTNYFHALGGTKEISLALDPDECNEGLEAAFVKAHCYTSVSSSEKDGDPPWNKDEDDDAILQIACSATSSIFLTSKGRLYQSGTLHGNVWTCPSRVEIAIPRKCIEIAAGRHFCIGRLEQGIGVVSWGAGHFGQLGFGQYVTALDKPQLIPHLLPQALGGSSAPRVRQVAAGAWHALALLDNGQVMAWGSNRKLQCGIKPATTTSSSTQASKTTPTISVPQRMDCSVSFHKVACGRLHSMGIEDKTGRVYTWGASHYGQCGHTTRRGGALAPPRLVEAMQKVMVVDVAAGDAHSLALTGGGRVFVWGSGMDGQLGLGGVIPISRPKLLADLDFVAIEAGREWKHKQFDSGGGGGGEPLFREFNATPPPPVQDAKHHAIARPPSPTRDRASHLSSVPKIVQIKAAGSYSVAVSSSGHVYTWGYNDSGQLGIPESSVELPLVEVTSSMMKQSSSGRLLQIRSFESKHNVLLPRRVDALANYRIDSVAVGPCIMWCMGNKRKGNDADVVGRTLYEAQEERRRRGLWRLRKGLSSSASASSASDGKSPIIVSIKAISKDDSEEIRIPDSVYTRGESTGMDEDGGSTTTYETQLSAGIILPLEGEQQTPSKVPTIREMLSVETPSSQASTKVMSLEETPPPGSPMSLTSDKTPPLTPNSLVSKRMEEEERPGAEETPSRESGRSMTLSALISRSSRKDSASKGKTESEELPPPENQGNWLPYSPIDGLPASTSASPLSYAGGRPTLPGLISPSGRNKDRSQSAPKSRPTASPSDAAYETVSSSTPSRNRFPSSIPVSRLVRGRRLPKTSKGETAKKGRVRKAFNCAFGK